jgi:hypothetical protein
MAERPNIGRLSFMLHQHPERAVLTTSAKPGREVRQKARRRNARVPGLPGFRFEAE